MKLTLREYKTIIKILLQSYKTGGNLKLTLRKCKTIIKMTGDGSMSNMEGSIKQYEILLENFYQFFYLDRNCF